MKENCQNSNYFFLLYLILPSYHFSGNIPANIAKLHASLSIHHKLHTGYSVKVLYAFSYDDVGRLVKDLIELRQNEAPVSDIYI